MEYRRRLARTALEVFILVAGCALALRGVWDKVPGHGVDAAGTIWFYNWIRHTLLNGISPFWTAHQYFPEGLDILATTGFNFIDAYLSIPLQLLLGFPRYLPPFVLVIMVGNGLATRALLRSMGSSRVAALAGGLVFALHPYFIFEMNNGRFTQVLYWFWPLALRELYLMAEDRRWRRAVLAGVFLALQAWTYWFAGHFLFLVGLPALLLVGKRMPSGWWKRLAVTGVVTIALVAPGVVAMLLKSSQGLVPGLGGETEEMGFTSMRIMSHSWWLLSPGSGPLKLALPTLLGTLAVILLCRARLLLGLTAALVVLLAAGPHQLLAGTMVRSPLWLGAELLLPGFDRFLYPYRLWSVMALVSAVALALLLDRIPGRPAARAGLAALLLLAITWPLHDELGQVMGDEAPIPAYVHAVRRAPGPVMDLPFPCAEEGLYHQILHGQPLVTGMGQALESMRPPGLLIKFREDALMTHLLEAARGHRLPPHLNSSSRPRKEWRWVVLHLGLHDRSPQVRWCIQPWPGPPNPKALRRSRMLMEELLGRPTVADQEAIAWDLWNLKPSNKVHRRTKR